MSDKSSYTGSNTHSLPTYQLQKQQEEAEEEVQSDPDDVEESETEIAVAQKRPAAARPPMSKKEP